MFKAPFITPESLSLRRAHSSVRENGYRLYGISGALWPRSMDFSFVEEESREAFILLSLSLRRASEIYGLKKSEFISIPAFSSKRPGVLQDTNLRDIAGVGAHLQGFKLEVTNDIDNDAHRVVGMHLRSDRQSMQIKPSVFVMACLDLLPSMSPDSYEAKTLREANSQKTGAN